jgi:hypothetical protein
MSVMRAFLKLSGQSRKRVGRFGEGIRCAWSSLRVDYNRDGGRASSSQAWMMQFRGKLHAGVDSGKGARDRER